MINLCSAIGLLSVFSTMILVDLYLLLCCFCALLLLVAIELCAPGRFPINSWSIRDFGEVLDLKPIE
jgi:hypothetical protein